MTVAVTVPPHAPPWHGVPGEYSVARPGPDVLVFGPTKWPAEWAVRAAIAGVLAVAGVQCLAIVAAVGYGLWYWGNNALGRGAWAEVTLAGTLAAAVAGLVGLVVLRVASAGQWLRFDRAAGVLAVLRRPLGVRRAPRPVGTLELADVAAVELRFTGVVEHPVSSRDEDRMPPMSVPRDHYEFALVLRDGGRLPVVRGPDWPWMRPAAAELAGFLGVPLDDRLHERGATV